MSPLEQISKHRTYLMGLSIIGILLYHQYFVHDIWLQVFVRFGGWGVEIFMFLSGLGITYSLKRNNLPKYYGNRLRRILPAYLISIALFFLILLISEEYTDSSWTGAVERWWFIKAILLFYLIAPLLKKVLDKWRWKGFIAILTADFFLLAFSYSKLMPQIFGANHLLMECTTRLPAFVLGMSMVLMPDYAKLIVGGGMRKYLLIPLLFSAMAIRVLTARKAAGVIPSDLIVNGVWHAFLFVTQRIIFCFITPAVCLVVSRFTPFSKAISLCGALSLELYLLHELIFWKAFSIFAWMPGGCWSGYLILAGSLALSLISAWLLHRLCSLLSKERGKN